MTQLFANNASTALTSDAGTTLNVVSSALFPAPTGGDFFVATLVRLSDSAREIVKVTAVAGTAWAVVRAQEGTTQLVFVAGDTVELRVTAGGLQRKADSASPTFTGPATFTGAVALPGNAVNPLEAVPLQQLGVVGSWTPTVTTAVGAVNVVNAVGRYEKTGRVVRLFARLRLTNTAGSNAFISSIDGLPFPISNEVGAFQVWGGAIHQNQSNLAGTTSDGTSLRDAYRSGANSLGVGYFNSVSQSGANFQVSTSTTQELWVSGLTYITP